MFVVAYDDPAVTSCSYSDRFYLYLLIDWVTESAPFFCCCCFSVAILLVYWFLSADLPDLLPASLLPAADIKIVSFV